MRARRLAIAAGVSAGVAGCGGSSSSSTASTVSPAAYRASVSKICAAYNASVTALPKSTTQSIQGLTTLANSAKNALAQISSVTPPASMTAAANRWQASLQQSETNVAKLLDAFKSGDTAQLRTLVEQGIRLNAQGNAQARALGLTSCAENATPSG